MRRTGFLVVAALCLSGATAAAQVGGVAREPRAFLVFSDGISITSGGSPTGRSGLSQYFRVSGVLRVYGHRGLEVSAIRIQDLVATSRFIDPKANPEADGLLLSYASLTRQRGGGFPSVFSIGGGVVTRATADPAVDRRSWAIQAGFESDLTRLPVSWADLTAGARLLVMPGSIDRNVYIAALTFGIRVG